MRKLSLQNIKEAFETLKQDYQVISTSAQSFVGLATDTRSSQQDQIFIALLGESFDAHHFLNQAIEKGATGIIAHRFETDFIQKHSGKITLIQVSDTLLALQNLATWSRRQFRGRVIGITGSNGKTTTKEFTASVLSECFKVHYSKGSFNNHWGVPFSLLQTPEDADVAVIEMGMNHYGEITRLVQIAEPDTVICTMVGRAHIEHFGTIDKIAQAKAEIYEAASSRAAFGFNLDNPWTQKMFQKYKPKAQKIRTFSEVDSKADVYLKVKSMDLKSIELEGHIQGVSKSVRVPVFGEQNVVNLMSAAVLGLCLGMTAEQVWNGLSQCRTIWGRNQVVTLKSGSLALFDAYNANPDSMKALLLNVQKMTCKGKKVGVFGEMLEMGDHASDFHKELGELAAQSGFQQIYFVGPSSESFSEGLKRQNYRGQVLSQKATSPEMIQHLISSVQKEDLLVFKGSRGMRLENLLKPLEPLDWIEKT